MLYHKARMTLREKNFVICHFTMTGSTPTVLVFRAARDLSPKRCETQRHLTIHHAQLALAVNRDRGSAEMEKKDEVRRAAAIRRDRCLVVDRLL